MIKNPPKLDILIIDDSQTWRALIEGILQDLIEPNSLDLREAGTLTEAIEVAIKGDFSPNLVLLDLGLPDATPKTVRDAILKMEGSVVVISGHVNPQIVAECVAAGAYDVLSKDDLVEIKLLLKATVIQYLRFIFSQKYIKPLMKKSMKYLLPVFAACLLASCASPKANNRTNYVPPSTAQVRLSVTKAQEKVTSAQSRSVKVSERLVEAAASAKTAKEQLVVLAKATAETPELHGLVLQLDLTLDSLTQSLLSARDENERLAGDLFGTQSDLTAAQSRAQILQTEVDAQTGLLNESNRKLNAAITQGERNKARAKRFKTIIIATAMLAIGAVMFGFFRMAAFAPPLVYLTAASPVAVGLALYFWLG